MSDGVRDPECDKIPCNGTSPRGWGLVWAALEESRENRESGRDGEKDHDERSDDDEYHYIQCLQQDDETAGKEEKSNFEESRDGSDGDGDIPVVPCLKANLSNEDIVAGLRERSIPLHIFANPLFDHDSKQRSGEAEYETQEP